MLAEARNWNLTEEGDENDESSRANLQEVRVRVRKESEEEREGDGNQKVRGIPKAGASYTAGSRRNQVSSFLRPPP